MTIKFNNITIIDNVTENNNIIILKIHRGEPTTRPQRFKQKKSVFMSLTKAEMVIHPVRFRILQALMGETLTTQQIADHLPDVPKSSIYRHLKMLLGGEMIAIVDTQLVNGIQEKRYGLWQRPYLDADDVSDITAADHLRYFTIYILATLRGFADYLESAADENGQVDLLADRVGYTEAALYVNPDELNALQQGLSDLLSQFANNQPGNGRHKHKFALITHPVKESIEKAVNE